MPVSKNTYTGAMQTYCRTKVREKKKKKAYVAELNCKVVNGLFNWDYMFVLLKITHCYSLQQKLIKAVRFSAAADFGFILLERFCCSGCSSWKGKDWSPHSETAAEDRGLDPCDAPRNCNTAASRHTSNPKFEFHCLKDVVLQNPSSHKDFNNYKFSVKTGCFQIFATLGA